MGAQSVRELRLHGEQKHPTLPVDLVGRLRDGIASCRTPRSLSLEARVVIRDLCRVAHRNQWPAEELIIALREACYATPEITRLTTTSEREAMLSTLVTECINDFYSSGAD
jgi:hypothetical protein